MRERLRLALAPATDADEAGTLLPLPKPKKIASKASLKATKAAVVSPPTAGPASSLPAQPHFHPAEFTLQPGDFVAYKDKTCLDKRRIVGQIVEIYTIVAKGQGNRCFVKTTNGDVLADTDYIFPSKTNLEPSPSSSAAAAAPTKVATVFPDIAHVQLHMLALFKKFEEGKYNVKTVSILKNNCTHDASNTIIRVVF